MGLRKDLHRRTRFVDQAAVTVVIPHIPTEHRQGTLRRTLASVQDQDHAVSRTIVVTDTSHDGAAATRNRGLAEVTTPWVAFIDDDDELLPHHTKTLLEAAYDSGADVVYPWFRVISSKAFDPFPGAFGRPFRADLLREQNYIPTPVLARTELLRSAGGSTPYGDQEESACDDWGTWLKLLDAGATFHHVPMVTWLWHWHGKHTSGLGSRW